jgi:hypothetical protein
VLHVFEETIFARVEECGTACRPRITTDLPAHQRLDNAVTTPRKESVRAPAIQLIITRERGLAMNENPLQGSFAVAELTGQLGGMDTSGITRSER